MHASLIDQLRVSTEEFNYLVTSRLAATGCYATTPCIATSLHWSLPQLVRLTIEICLAMVRRKKTRNRYNFADGAETVQLHAVTIVTAVSEVAIR